MNSVLLDVAPPAKERAKKPTHTTPRRSRLHPLLGCPLWRPHIYRYTQNAWYPGPRRLRDFLSRAPPDRLSAQTINVGAPPSIFLVRPQVLRKEMTVTRERNMRTLPASWVWKLYVKRACCASTAVLSIPVSAVTMVASVVSRRHT